MFYSQQIAKSVKPDNVCAKCEKKFETWSLYHDHVLRVKCVKVIRPLNTSGRSVTQIINDWELKHKENIYK